MSTQQANPDTGIQKKMEQITTIVKRHVPRLVDVILVKTALERAKEYIESVDDSSGEKDSVMPVIHFALTKVEQWENKILHDIATQVLELSQEGE